MSPELALRAKDQGNKLFKEGKLAESAKLYAEAEKLDPGNIIYPSNLSAALYETGDYLGCASAIIRSWFLQPEPTLSLKLSTRLAKALSHGVQNGSIKPSDVEEKASAIQELEGISADDNLENVAAWRLWKTIRAKLSYYGELSHEARIRLSRMPIYKGTPDPALSYFVFGTDDVISLADGWGPKHLDPIDFRGLPKEQLSQLSFLVAGVGDARHAFGTVIGLGNAYKRLKPVKRRDFKAHVTLLDIHFATIARDLVFFVLINQLVENQVDTRDRLEIQTTLFFLYVGWIIPSYCETRFMAVINDLMERLSESPPRLPRWLHVDPNSIVPIIRALKYWSTDKSKTAAGFLDAHTHVNAGERIAAMTQTMSLQGFGNPRQRDRDEAERALDNLSDEQLLAMSDTFQQPNATAAEIREIIQDNKEMLVEKMVADMFDDNPKLGLSDEAAWYKSAMAFIPPEKLWDQHPGFGYFREISDDKASQSRLKNMAKTVKKSWKPNVTLLDGTQEGYMQFESDDFGIVRQIATFNEQNGISVPSSAFKKRSPAFAYVSAFFDGVVEAVRDLGNSFQVEFICGEVNQELSKIRLRTDSRPESFPKHFTRIWLSNIPDYTNGTLNTVVYVLPALQNTNISAVCANCMWNAPVWKSDDEFCYNYTLLLPKDLLRYLGVRTLRGDAVMSFLTLGSTPHPRPLTTLASKDELRAWLTRLLLCILSPGKSQARPNMVKLPNNLVAFVGLLVELQSIGYPSHWIAEYVQSLLSNNLITDRVVYRDKIPRPVSELATRGPMHRVRLDPWIGDLEAIFASSMHGLPFALQIPNSLAKNVEDIGLYKASIEPNMFYTSRFKFPSNDAVISLLFYKNVNDLHERSLDSFLEKLPNIIDGNGSPAVGSFHILTSLDFVDFTQSEIRWRMSKTMVAKMRQERWSMIAWRTDFWVSTLEPCPASRWQNVDIPV